jgi:hypothetical protein
MTIWVLIVYLQVYHGESPHTITMQEFNGQKNCQAAGTKLWELSGRKTLWACVEK